MRLKIVRSRCSLSLPPSSFFPLLSSFLLSFPLLSLPPTHYGAIHSFCPTSFLIWDKLIAVALAKRQEKLKIAQPRLSALSHRFCTRCTGPRHLYHPHPTQKHHPQGSPGGEEGGRLSSRLHYTHTANLEMRVGWMEDFPVFNMLMKSFVIVPGESDDIFVFK